MSKQWYWMVLVMILALGSAACGDDELPPGHPGDPSDQEGDGNGNDDGNDGDIEDDIDDDLLEMTEECAAHCEERYVCDIDDGVQEEEAEWERVNCSLACDNLAFTLQYLRNAAADPDLQGIVYDDADGVRACIEARKEYALCTYAQECNGNDACETLKTNGETICEQSGVKK